VTADTRARAAGGCDVGVSGRVGVGVDREGGRVAGGARRHGVLGGPVARDRGCRQCVVVAVQAAVGVTGLGRGGERVLGGQRGAGGADVVARTAGGRRERRRAGLCRSRRTVEGCVGRVCVGVARVSRVAPAGLAARLDRRVQTLLGVVVAAGDVASAGCVLVKGVDVVGGVAVRAGGAAGVRRRGVDDRS